jgi:hypothetical protein
MFLAEMAGSRPAIMIGVFHAQSNFDGARANFCMRQVTQRLLFVDSRGRDAE